MSMTCGRKAGSRSFDVLSYSLTIHVDAGSGATTTRDHWNCFTVVPFSVLLSCFVIGAQEFSLEFESKCGTWLFKAFKKQGNDSSQMERPI